MDEVQPNLIKMINPSSFISGLNKSHVVRLVLSKLAVQL